jgi:uncharacterized membrane protein YdjX (TVP38/TMEM64 family)
MKRMLLLVGVVGAAVILSKFLVEDVFGLPLEAMSSAVLADAGSGTAVLIVLLLAADLVLPVPSSLVMIMSGAAFGVVGGSALALVGSVGGEWLGFELVRRYGRRAASRLVSDDELAHLEAVFARHGVAAVFVTRALPILMETVSVVAGLSGMSRRSFLLASVAGTAPVVVAYTWAGAMSRHVSSLLPAIVILVAVTGGAWLWYRSR